MSNKYVSSNMLIKYLKEKLIFTYRSIHLNASVALAWTAIAQTGKMLLCWEFGATNDDQLKANVDHQHCGEKQFVRWSDWYGSLFSSNS